MMTSPFVGFSSPASIFRSVDLPEPLGPIIAVKTPCVAPAVINNPAIVGAVLNLFDQGSSTRDVCQLAITIGLVGQIAGSTNSIDIARMAFLNVVGVPASTEMADLLVSFMDGRNASFSQADFLTVIAGMEINQAHIGLIGLQQTGIEFI